MLNEKDYEVLLHSEEYDFPHDVILFAKRALTYTGDHGFIGQYLSLLANDVTISFRIRAVLRDLMRKPRADKFINDADFMAALADAPFITNMCESLLRLGAHGERATWAFKSILSLAAFEKNNPQY